MSERPSDGIGQPTSHVKLTVDVAKDVLLGHYGFDVSQNLPLLVTSVAEGKTISPPYSSHIEDTSPRMRQRSRAIHGNMPEIEIASL